MGIIVCFALPFSTLMRLIHCFTVFLFQFGSNIVALADDVTDEELKEHFNYMDKDKDGKVHFKEILETMIPPEDADHITDKDREEAKEAQAKLHELFPLADTDGDDQVEPEEYRKLLTAFIEWSKTKNKEL